MLNLANQQCMQDSTQELLYSPMLNKLESKLLNIKECQYPVGTAQDQLCHDINNNISKKDSEIKKVSNTFEYRKTSIKFKSCG